MGWEVGGRLGKEERQDWGGRGVGGGEKGEEREGGEGEKREQEKIDSYERF